MKKRLLCMLLALVMVCTLLPVPAFADFVIGTIMINYVEINGIDMPVAGELPDREVELPLGAAYTVAAPENFANSFINGVAWYDVTTNKYMAEGEVFVSGHEYYPIIGLKAPANHKFANIHSITGKTNLCDDIDVAGFYNADETQYISVYLGTMNDEWSAQPLHRNTITTQNCIAYNAAGEQITSALEGETVTVRGATSIMGQTFNGWILNPSNLQVTHDGVQQMHFVMPAEPVSITGSYEDYMLTTVRLFFDDCVAGNEVDFTASNMSGSMMYPGYHCMTPEGHGNVFYNGVAWWDDTDGRYLHPGDVYEANHVYQISAIIAADNGYVFDSRENLMVYTYPGGQCTVEELYISALDSTKHKFITSGDIIPVVPHSIDLRGGKAYDQYGNEITEAMPGDTITLVADEPGFGWQFDMWSVMGVDADLEDPYTSTTTMIMPDTAVTIFSNYTEAPKVAVDQVSFSLLGYYINANAACLQVKTSENVAFVDNNINDLSYIVFADNAGIPSGTQVTGALRNTAKHWIAVKVEPAFGYTLEGLTLDKISAPFAEKVLMTADEDGAVNVFMLATYPPKVTGRSTVTVTNGNALINNTVVTNAVFGMTVKVEAQEAPEGKFFAGWNVISGNVELENSSEPATSFTMGSTAVELEAVFKDYISYVELQIQEPQAGMTPSYLAKIDLEAAYELDENNNIYCRNGVIWYDVDTEENLDPNTAVFQPGHCYGLQILLRAKDGERFLLDDYDYPAVTGCVNGLTDGVYVDRYTQDSAKQVILSTSFYIEENAEIVPPVSEIHITGIDVPEESMALDYTPEWDYMDYISPTSILDDEDTLNGVTWTDVTYENHVVMRPEYAVAARNHMYRVDILVNATNNRIFSMDESGMPAVDATVNGEACDVSFVEGLVGTRYLLLTYFVTTKPVYTLSVVGGLAAVNGTYAAAIEVEPGTEVMLMPGAAPDGQEFNYWSITSGDVMRQVYETNYQFEMPEADVIAVPAYTVPHTHTGEPIAYKASTCTEEGWLEHYYCEFCGRYSLDGTYADLVDYATQIAIGTVEHYVGGLEYDAKGHYGVCGFGCGKVMTEVLPHDMGIKHDEHQHWAACDCGYVEEGSVGDHEFSIGLGLCGNIRCECGAITVAGHNFEDGTCTTCGQNLIEAIDLNNDSKVTVFDAQILAEANAGLRTLSDEQIAALGNICVQDIIDYVLGRYQGA